MTRRFTVMAALIVLCVPGLAGAASKTEKITESHRFADPQAEPANITINRLRGHVYFLASDYLAGRVAGSSGYRVAAEYAVSQFAAAGLQPFQSDRQDHDGFLQTVPLVVSNNDSTTRRITTSHAAIPAAGTCFNVAGYVPGTDPDLGKEFVLVSAHLDHIPPISGEICNGADDNASGCAALMEIACLVAKDPCERSVLFVHFTAEDYGASPRLGSRYFLEHWPSERGRIFANVNLDMIGREDTTWPKPGGITVMNSESVCSELRDVCVRTNARTSRLELHYDVSQGGASDSRTFADAGIPSLGLFTGAHKDLHKPSDEVDRISFRRIQEIAGLALEIVRELASGETHLCE